ERHVVVGRQYAVELGLREKLRPHLLRRGRTQEGAVARCRDAYPRAIAGGVVESAQPRLARHGAPDAFHDQHRTLAAEMAEEIVRDIAREAVIIGTDERDVVA